MTSAPRGGWGQAVSNVFALWRDPIGFYAHLADTQGDLARAGVGPRQLVLANHPDLVWELLVARDRSCRKGYSLMQTRILLGDGLLTSDGAFHRRQRRLMQPAFHRRRIAEHGEMVVRYALESTADWQDGQERNISSDMLRLSQRVVAKALFDTDIHETDARQAAEALDAVVRGFGVLLLPYSHVLLRLPLPTLRRLRRARVTLDGLIGRMIEDRRQSGDRGDLLSMLLFSVDDQGNGMSDQQVRDEAMTSYLAGHDTTGCALMWTWYLLSEHPDVEQRWHDELDAVLGGRAPVAEDFARLTYTRHLLKESMRLYPPVWSVGRQVKEPMELGGQAVPQGAIVQVSQWLLHRDGRFFPEPLRFWPERWTPEFEKQLPKGAYFPFGLGHRQCIGMDFAWMTGVLVLAAQGQRWRMRLTPGYPVETLPRITLRAKHGLGMRLQRR